MMNGVITIGEGAASWQQVAAIAYGQPAALSEAAWQRIHAAREGILALATSGTPYYGINTGLGALCDVILPPEDLAKLSRYTLFSHACGVGEALSCKQTRAVMAAALINYSHGASGISPAIVEALLHLLNTGITPVVPARGSVGYLTHMAHIGLALIGEGEVEKDGKRLPAAQALQESSLAPIVPGAKDGLSLVNGTPAMTGIAALAIAECMRFADWADVVGAMSFEALNGQTDAIDAAVVARKPYPGVAASAANLHLALQGSEQVAQSRGMHLQDALSVRSIIQVHGACREQLAHAARQIDYELNSATDNPLIIFDNGKPRIISQANPHGEAVALACDVLAMAVCEWGSISERRSYRLITPQTNRLPPFLTEGSGVKSGMMIAQYSAASLAADNRRLAIPAVADNYLTSGLQEDHLSFGDSAALKLSAALDNTRRILAIEYLLAAQGFEYIAHGKGKGTQAAWQALRKHVPAYAEEHPLSADMEAAYRLICSHNPRAFLQEKSR